MSIQTPSAAYQRVQKANREGKTPIETDVELAKQYRPNSKMVKTELKRQEQQKSQTQQNNQTSLHQPLHHQAEKPELNPHTVNAVLSGNISEKKSQQTHKQKEWNTFFAKQFGPLVVLVLWICTQDFDKASFYAPSPDECQAIAPHLSKIAPKIEAWLHVPEQVHDGIMMSDNIVAFSSIVIAYLNRTHLDEKIAGSVFKKVEKKQHDRRSEVVQPVQSNNNGTTGSTGVDISSFAVYGIGAQYEP